MVSLRPELRRLKRPQTQEGENLLDRKQRGEPEGVCLPHRGKSWEKGKKFRDPGEGIGGARWPWGRPGIRKLREEAEECARQPRRDLGQSWSLRFWSGLVLPYQGTSSTKPPRLAPGPGPAVPPHTPTWLCTFTFVVRSSAEGPPARAPGQGIVACLKSGDAAINRNRSHG